ncbi:MAG: PIF1 family DEAD/DEAH box helicase [Candidatus Falkowbacteria bacterium]|nr:PIF1 family DEAD/DEAH box helicase [Candidatus Falkowbacteria bacterium]
MTQKEALEIIKTGENIFLTGPAGCGKTFLLNTYLRFLQENKIGVGVTASTGIAATHLDGRTIHSWCGIGIEDRLDQRKLKKILHNRQTTERVRSSKVLIIDEISMLDARRFDLVDTVCRAIRGDLRPFGGLQVVLCGDFFQLPPVRQQENNDGVIFESEAWQELNLRICYLEEQFRQEDKRFSSVLASIRANQNLEDSLAILAERLEAELDFPLSPTKLFTHNQKVDTHNTWELEKLTTPSRFYEMQVSGPANLIKKIKDGCLAPEKLELKSGAVVMFVRNNFVRGFVNGTIGEIVAFDGEGFPIVKTLRGNLISARPETWRIGEGDEVLASLSQVPLRLAWAITVHKSQGMSLDCAEIDLSRSFEFGMGYVALSRVRSLAGIRLLGINQLALQVDQRVISLDQKLRQKSKEDLSWFKSLKLKDKKKLFEKLLSPSNDSLL